MRVIILTMMALALACGAGVPEPADGGCDVVRQPLDGGWVEYRWGPDCDRCRAGRDDAGIWGVYCE